MSALLPTTATIPVSTSLGPIRVNVILDLDLMLMEELAMVRKIVAWCQLMLDMMIES